MSENNEATVEQPTEVAANKAALTEAEQQAKTHALIAYGLMLVGFIIGLTFLAGVIWAYVKKGDAANTKFYDHYENVIKTFWISFGLGVVGVITTVFFIGYLILIAAAIYTLYMLIKGVAKLTSDRSFSEA